MNEQQVAPALHWVWAAIFLGLGIFLIVKGRCHAGVRRVFKGVRASTRIEEAITRRETAEGDPAPLGWWMGCASIALSFAAAFSSLPVGLLYAVLCLCMAVLSAATFLQLRNLQRTRVAVLSPRSPEKVIPPVWFAVAIACALCALTVVGDPVWRAPSLLVCASSTFTVFIAWRLTQLGAILTGEDPAAEHIVDERVRFYRSSTALLLAFAQPFVFISQMYANDGISHWVAYFATCLAFLAYLFWMLRRQRAAVRLA